MPACSRYFSIDRSKLFAVAGFRFGLPVVKVPEPRSIVCEASDWLKPGRAMVDDQLPRASRVGSIS
jgi:hypothetical protein